MSGAPANNTKALNKRCHFGKDADKIMNCTVLHPPPSNTLFIII